MGGIEQPVSESLHIKWYTYHFSVYEVKDNHLANMAWWLKSAGALNIIGGYGAAKQERM